jgi:hypothetical protein
VLYEPCTIHLSIISTKKASCEPWPTVFESFVALSQLTKQVEMFRVFGVLRRLAVAMQFADSDDSLASRFGLIEFY